MFARRFIVVQTLASARAHGHDDPEDPDDNGHDDLRLFHAEVGDVVPLANRDIVPRGTSRAGGRTGQARAPRGRFVVEYLDGRVEGRASGVTREQLSVMRAGKLAPDAKLDLHGMSREHALRALDRFIDGSTGRKPRCVLVVIGRGVHSTDGPVIGPAVIDRLARGRVSRRIRAFCTAAGRDGRDGALYVLVNPR